jgi:hypothetical protein
MSGGIGKNSRPLQSCLSDGKWIGVQPQTQTESRNECEWVDSQAAASTRWVDQSSGNSRPRSRRRSFSVGSDFAPSRSRYSRQASRACDDQPRYRGPDSSPVALAPGRLDGRIWGIHLNSTLARASGESIGDFVTLRMRDCRVSRFVKNGLAREPSGRGLGLTDPYVHEAITPDGLRRCAMSALDRLTRALESVGDDLLALTRELTKGESRLTGALIGSFFLDFITPNTAPASSSVVKFRSSAGS